MNKIRNYAWLLAVMLIGLFIFSCSEDNENMNGFNLENKIYINLKNTEGENLLDSSVENYYNVENMKLFYLINNESVEVTVEKFHSDGIELTSDKSLQIATNPSSSNIIEKTSDYNVAENIAFLQLSETDTDTIKIHPKTGQNYFLVSKVWYNNELVWERETEGGIEITKE